jgi:hypothetical protein
LLSPGRSAELLAVLMHDHGGRLQPNADGTALIYEGALCGDPPDDILRCQYERHRDHLAKTLSGVSPSIADAGKRQPTFRVKRLKFYVCSRIFRQTCEMTDGHTHTLQDMVADRECWSTHAGKHYRELAHWLRGIAAKCRLPYTQKELLDLARRYEIRADRIRRGPVVR